MSEFELISMSEHLAYEIGMMRQCATLMQMNLQCDELLQPENSSYYLTIKNAVLESFLIHARSLYDFLFVKPRNDDVSAEHYFVTLLERQAQLKLYNTDALKDFRRKTNKHMAHLTEKRLDIMDFFPLVMWGWDFNGIRKELDEALSFFVLSVPSELLSPRLKQMF